MPKPQYAQKFRQAWLKDPLLKDWLQAVESTAKCKLCSQILTSRYSELKSHGESRKHKTNAKNIVGTSQPKIPFTRLDQLDGARKAEARLALFVAKHTAIIWLILVKTFLNAMKRIICKCTVQNVVALFKMYWHLILQKNYVRT
jgi:hypothetical protein